MPDTILIFSAEGVRVYDTTLVPLPYTLRVPGPPIISSCFDSNRSPSNRSPRADRVFTLSLCDGVPCYFEVQS